MALTTTATDARPTLLQALNAFHTDEDGLEALQVVMICGIAAVILLLIAFLIPQVRKWVVDNVNTLMNKNKETGQGIDQQ